MKWRIFLRQGLVAALLLGFGAAPLGAATHLGVTPGKHLVLYHYQNKLYRITPAGKTTEFTKVPDGYALVITDINWQIFGTANKLYDLDISAVKLPYSPLVFRAVVKTDAAGDGGLKQNLTSGLVFGPGMAIFPLTLGATTVSLYLGGYLTTYP